MASRECVVRAEIKFCGLTRPEDAEHAASLGASYVGVIFAGGPRNLTPERAANVLAAVPREVQRVGVFADQTVDDIAAMANRLRLDVVQLHGSASATRIAAIRAQFGGKIWPVCRVAEPPLPADVTELIDLADGLVLDSYVRGTLVEPG